MGNLQDYFSRDWYLQTHQINNNNKKNLNNNINQVNQMSQQASQVQTTRYFQYNIDVPEVILSGVMSTLVDMWHGRRDKFLSTASLKAAGVIMLGNIVGQYVNTNFVNGLMPSKDPSKLWDYILFDAQDVVLSSVSYVLLEKLFDREGKLSTEFLHGVISYSLAEIINEFTFKAYFSESKMSGSPRLF